jgi:hypothetical protein
MGNYELRKSGDQYILTHCATKDSNELYHYGVKGMKWGVRRDRDGGSSSASARRKKNVAQELGKNSATMKDYVKAVNKYGLNSPQAVAARKRANEQKERLRKQVVNYLKSISKQDADKLIKFDSEHGKHYVESKVFDKRYADYDDGIYID